MPERIVVPVNCVLVVLVPVAILVAVLVGEHVKLGACTTGDLAVEALLTNDGADLVIREFVLVGFPAEDVLVDVAAAVAGVAKVNLVPVSAATATPPGRACMCDVLFDAACRGVYACAQCTVKQCRRVQR